MSLPCADRVDCFSVYAAADPSALPRIFEVFSLFGLVPSRCHTTRQDEDEGMLVVDLQVDGLPEGDAHRVVNRLSRVITVTSVLWSERRPTMQAA